MFLLLCFVLGNSQVPGVVCTPTLLCIVSNCRTINASSKRSNKNNKQLDYIAYANNKPASIHTYEGAIALEKYESRAHGKRTNNNKKKKNKSSGTTKSFALLVIVGAIYTQSTIK